MVWILGAILLAASVVLVERLLVSPEDLVTAEDLLALPHGRVRLIARLERYIIRFFDPPLRGRKIEFFEGDRRLGEAVTDDRGFATLEVEVGAVGRRRFRVVSPRAEESAIVDVLPADAPVLVLDVDHTITEISTFRFAFTSNPNIHSLPDAIDVIPRLAKRFSIVYLTARDHSFLGKTRSWLRLNNLPDGPVFLRRRRFWSQAAVDHKLERLGELKRTHRIVAGVGDLPTDVKAYLSNGMAAYHMDPGGKWPHLEGSTKVRSWKELEEKLTATSAPSAT
jgi:hypothetical protein